MLQLTDAEKQRLLDLARKALEEVVRLGRMSEPAEPAGALQTPCGAFVTLYKGRRLRGCIGLVEARRPLYATVRECARAAALDDPRFDPVAPAELLSLRLGRGRDTSYLIPPARIRTGAH